MFVPQEPRGYREVLPGIELKTLAYGDSTLMAEFRLKEKASLPLHAHPHEQTGYLVKGRLRLTIGSDVHEVRAGDSWCVPGGVRHGAQAVEEAVAIEVFSPVREDYLPATAPSPG